MIDVTRCGWCGDDPLYCRYHDEEWGVPQRDGRVLFEKLCDRVHFIPALFLNLRDIRSALEPRYCVDGTGNVAEMQSDLALSWLAERRYCVRVGEELLVSCERMEMLPLQGRSDREDW